MPTISFSGIASGIDGDAIIKATLDARRLAFEPLKQKVEQNTNENAAFEEFNTKLLSLDGAVKDFLTLAGSAVSKTAISSDESSVVATARAGAFAASSNLTVQQLARTATMSFNNRFSGLEAPIAPGISGTETMQITLGTGAAQKTFSVSINASTTLSTLVNQINDLADGSVRASVFNAGTAANPQYALVLNGIPSGTEAGTLGISVPASISSLQGTTLSQAQDAVVTLEGIGQVTRPSNTITDLIPGVSLELKGITAAPVTVSVRNDADKTAARMAEMIEAINEVIRYSNDNDKIERIETEKGPTNQYGTLARSRVDDQAIEAIKAALSGARSGNVGSAIQVFADLGVTTERDGTLKFDQSKFLDAVEKDGAAVDQVLHSFADRVGTATGIVAEYTKFQGVIKQSIATNDDENKRLNDRLTRLEETLEEQRKSLSLLFSNLEKKIGELNSTSQSLVGMLAGRSG